MKITETHAQEHFEDGSYIPQLFTRSSHLENTKCLTGVAHGGWDGLFCFRLSELFLRTPSTVTITVCPPEIGRVSSQ